MCLVTENIEISENPMSYFCTMLGLHTRDSSSDCRIINNNFMCFNERQVLNSADVTGIKNLFFQFYDGL